MRPQRARAASTMAARLASRVTSASHAMHSPREVVVDGEHLGSLLHETQHGGAAVAQALARRLAGAHHDGDLVLETHVDLAAMGLCGSLWKSSARHEPCSPALIMRGNAG